MLIIKLIILMLIKKLILNVDKKINNTNSNVDKKN